MLSELPLWYASFISLFAASSASSIGLIIATASWRKVEKKIELELDKTLGWMFLKIVKKFRTIIFSISKNAFSLVIFHLLSIKKENQQLSFQPATHIQNKNWKIIILLASKRESCSIWFSHFAPLIYVRKVTAKVYLVKENVFNFVCLNFTKMLGYNFI